MEVIVGEGGEVILWEAIVGKVVGKVDDLCHTITRGNAGL